MTAEQIQRALRRRHSKDLYISECKNGPTQSIGARPIRLDGWAFLKTWSPVTSIGYEVKVSRSDFVNDHKWRDYLGLCHQFYFVAPKGLIQPEELSPEAGLVEALGGRDGAPARLVMRRKAVYRTPDTALYESLLHYVLMCRVRVGGTWVDVPHDEREAADVKRVRIDQWGEWLAQRKDGAEIGNRVGHAVRDELNAMRVKVSQAQAKVEHYENTRATLRFLGLDPDTPERWGLEKRIERALGVVTPELLDAVHSAIHKLSAAAEAFECIRRVGEAQGVHVSTS